MNTDVYFPPIEPVWAFGRDSVRFQALVDHKVVVCLITAEALVEVFGAHRRDNSFDAASCLRAFREHRNVIETAAREKIRQSGQWTSEIVLRIHDFATPDDPVVSSVRAEVSPEIENDPVLKAAVDKVGHILDEKFNHNRTTLDANWTSFESKGGPLLYLRLTDQQTEGSAERLFTLEEIGTDSSVPSSLRSLWDDLLQSKMAMLLARVNETASAEEDR